MTTQTFTLSLVGLATLTWLYRPLSFIRTHTFASSVYWTIRSWLWSYPVTPEFDMWDEGDPIEEEKWMKERRRIIRTWNFLRPFFAARGYDLYTKAKPEPSSSRLV